MVENHASLAFPWNPQRAKCRQRERKDRKEGRSAHVSDARGGTALGGGTFEGNVDVDLL